MTKYDNALRLDLLAGAEIANYPAIVLRGMCVIGRAQWVRAITEALPADLNDIERQLRPIVERAAKWAETEREIDQRAAERRQRDRDAAAAAIRGLLR